MPLMGKSFDDLCEADLLSLIENDVCETARIEFKRDTYGANDQSKREFLKDITAIANTYGGMIVIGMEENKGVASSIFPLQNIDIDEEILRLDGIANTGCKPTITGLQIKNVSVTDGAVVIVRIPKSWNPPHRADQKSTKRFYKRNSAGCYEMDVNELRKVFTQGMDLNDKLKAFRRGRIDKITAGETPIQMRAEQLFSFSGSGCFVMHIIPINAFENYNEVSVAKISNSEAHLSPVETGGSLGKYNLDGIVSYDSNKICYTQLFRDGVIETVHKGICKGNANKIIQCLTIAKYIVRSVERYIAFLKTQNLSPPFKIYTSLIGVKGCRFVTVHKSMEDDDFLPFDRNEVLFPPVDILEYGDVKLYYEALKPILDALWNADGRASCDYYNEKGEWVGHKDLR